MADADVSGPPGNLSEGGSSQGGGDAPSVGPGTGRNESNPARGVSFDAPNLSGLMGGLTGMLGFDPSSPVTGVNVETEEEAPHTHPDFNLSGTAMDPTAPSPGVSLTEPGYSKAVDDQGNALSYNLAMHRNNLAEYGKKAISLREQLTKEKNKSKKDYGKIRELTRSLKAIEESPQYSKHMALQNPALGWGAKALASLMGLSPLSFAQALENRAIELGFVDDTTPDQTIEAANVDGGPSLFGSTSDGPVIIDEELTEEVAPVLPLNYGTSSLLNSNTNIFNPSAE